MPKLSNRQIDRLGERLRRSDPTAEDLEVLGQVGELYADALAEVLSVLADLSLEPVGRLKTVGTLVDKLRRIPEPLSRIQDVAGARVVAEMSRDEQDHLVERITARFENYRIKDRRAEPSYGYRAVHVIVKVQGRLVEIQVRTHLQDLWAQIVERLADAWGRGIRYGEPPAEPDLLVAEGVTRQMFVEGAMEFAEVIDLAEKGAVLLAEANRRTEVVGTRRERFHRQDKGKHAEVSARFEKADQRLRELLLRLHDLTAPGTLKP